MEPLGTKRFMALTQQEREKLCELIRWYGVNVRAPSDLHVGLLPFVSLHTIKCVVSWNLSNRYAKIIATKLNFGS